MERNDKKLVAPMQQVQMSKEEEERILTNLRVIMQREEAEMIAPRHRRRASWQSIKGAMAGIATVFLVGVMLWHGWQNNWLRGTGTTANVHPPRPKITSTNSGPMIPAKLTLAKQRVKTLNAVSFMNNQIGFVVSKDSIYKTTDGGQTWAQVYTGKEPILGLDAKYQPDANEQNVTAYTKTYLLRSTNGKTFIKQTVGGKHPNIQGLTLLPNDIIYMVNDGTVYASSGMNGSLYKATPTTSVTSVAATSDATCYAVSGTSVYKTTTEGQNWTKVFTAPIKTSARWKTEMKAQGNHVAVLFYDNGHAVNQEPYILYESSDAGNSWRSMVDEPYYKTLYPNAKPLNKAGGAVVLGPFTMDANGDVFMTGIDITSGTTQVLTVISPSGKTIARDPIAPSANSPHAFDFPNHPIAVATPDGKHVFVVGSNNGKGVMEKSTDGGLTFQAK